MGQCVPSPGADLDNKLSDIVELLRDVRICLRDSRSVRKTLVNQAHVVHSFLKS